MVTLKLLRVRIEEFKVYARAEVTKPVQ